MQHNTKKNNHFIRDHRAGGSGSFLALTPLILFLGLYLLSSVGAGDFYCMPIAVAFVAASIYALMLPMRGEAGERLCVARKVEAFSAGAANSNILLMIWIFILAGAFAQSAKAMGAIDATVNLTLQLLPPQMMAAGLFLAACFISIAVGTSVGTIVALIPVASGIAAHTGMEAAYLAAVVVGGSFFGDNLSFISDTTIAATRTQGCALKDKFRVNIRIVIPAAMITFLLYALLGSSQAIPVEAGTVEWVKVIPYLLVLITALCGVNVMIVLILGLISSGVIGCLYGVFTPLGWCTEMGVGINGMGELIIVTMLAGGMLEVIRRNGGIDYLISRLTRRIRGPRGAEGAIAALVSLANLCTANNTIAILTVGPIARSIAERFGVDLRKSASLLDTFSCVVQGVLPYGAQLLMAAGLCALSPVEIIRYLYYPPIMGLCAVVAILIRRPRLKSPFNA